MTTNPIRIDQHSPLSIPFVFEVICLPAAVINEMALACVLLPVIGWYFQKAMRARDSVS